MAVILVTGINGATFEVDDSRPWVAAQLKSGALARAGQQPAAAEQQTPAMPPAGRPPVGATKADWVAWAITQGAEQAAAEAMTKEQLIAQYGAQ